MPDSPIIRRTEAMLGMLSRGKFLEKCDDHMRAAIESLESLPAEKGTASLTINLTFTYASGRLDVTPTVKSKLPEEKGFAATPFWTHEGALSVQHPSQIDLFRGVQPVTPDRSAAQDRETA